VQSQLPAGQVLALFLVTLSYMVIRGWHTVTFSGVTWLALSYVKTA